MCSHAFKKSSLKSFFARCMQCLSPQYISENPEACELMFQKLLEVIILQNHQWKYG